MSMKFLTGLQDLLGLYEAGSPSSSPASPIPPTSSAIFAPMPSQQYNSGTSVRKKVSDANRETTGEQIRQCSHDRNVSFPDESSLITGFHEAPLSIFHSGKFGDFVDIAEITSAYRDACRRLNCAPIASIEKQIGFFHKSPADRQEMLCLKGEKISHLQMESLEEIFKRVQFNTIDFEYTFLDDNSAISLGEMIEFYDSCTRLNLSFNQKIEDRGWNTLFRAAKHASSLQMLNLRYTAQNDRTILSLSRIFRISPPIALSCIHLENTQLSGKNLYVLICALKFNTGLKELYLGDNALQGTDGSHIYQLITSNTSIQLLDLRNNNLSDSGVRHISDALRNKETLKNSALSAIVLWNNNVTGASMNCLAEALKENPKIETINIGSNKLGVNGISKLKPALVSNTHLHRLGLQKTDLDCQGAIILAECIADNTALVRVDIRENPIALAGLLALHSAMKMNKSITLLNIDSNCVKLNNEKEEFERYFAEIQRYCERNKEEVMRRLVVTFENEEEEKERSKEDAEEAKENVEDEDLENNDSKDDKNDTQICDKAPLESIKSVENNNNESVKENVLHLARSSSSSSARRDKLLPRFTRSLSLTCSETVHDIHDRLREMGGSTHSLDTATSSSSSSASSNSSAPLDATSNVDSMKTIKKAFTVSPTNPSPLPLAEWGSLPALPQASPTSTPVVRKLRRFSVSPSSSVFDVSKSSSSSSIPPTIIKDVVHESVGEACLPVPSTPSRPQSLAIGIPLSGSVPSGPSSAPLPLFQEPPVWTPTRIVPLNSTNNTVVPNEEKTLNRRAAAESDEDIRKACRSVMNDLLNYIEYEENAKIERKASILMKNTFTQPPSAEELSRFSRMMSNSESTSSLRTPLTPSRIIEISEELGGETDEIVVQQVLRQLVRDVLRCEKDELRSTLDRRRKHQGSSSRSSPV